MKRLVRHWPRALQPVGVQPAATAVLATARPCCAANCHRDTGGRGSWKWRWLAWRRGAGSLPGVCGIASLRLRGGRLSGLAGVPEEAPYAALIAAGQRGGDGRLMAAPAGSLPAGSVQSRTGHQRGRPARPIALRRRGWPGCRSPSRNLPPPDRVFSLARCAADRPSDWGRRTIWSRPGQVRRRTGRTARSEPPSARDGATRRLRSTVPNDALC